MTPVLARIRARLGIIKIIPLSEAKNTFSRIVDAVADRGERVMITRHGKPAALMMDPAELERLIATLDILSDPDMMKQIERSKREFAAGKYKTYASDEELDELFGPS